MDCAMIFGFFFYRLVEKVFAPSLGYLILSLITTDLVQFYPICRKRLPAGGVRQTNTFGATFLQKIHIYLQAGLNYTCVARARLLVGINNPSILCLDVVLSFN